MKVRLSFNLFLLSIVFQLVLFTSLIAQTNSVVPDIYFTSPLKGNAGTSIPLAIDKGGSTGTITFNVENISGTASLTGSDLSLTTPGLVRITASVSADANYEGTSLSQIVTINNNNGSAVILKSKIYGTTFGGGVNNAGVLYQMNGDLSNYTILNQFAADPGGASPFNQQLIQASDGKLYGTLPNGGAHNLGVLFQFNPIDGSYLPVHQFSEDDGGLPGAKLLEASDGKLYGVTTTEGGFRKGTLFQYNFLTDEFEKKIDFTSATGSQANGGLIEVNGILYGQTYTDGLNGNGTIFSYQLSNGLISVIHDFGAYPSGGKPFGDLTLADNGKLYGLTSMGGPTNSGSIYEYDITNSLFTEKVNLDYQITGTAAMGSFAEAPNGKLYALLAYGGVNFSGTIIEYDPGATSCTNKYDFGNTGPGNPYGNFALGNNGVLYGLSPYGGTNGKGLVFEYAPGSTTIAEKYSFANNDGSSPFGTLTLAQDNTFYGLTSVEGEHGSGTLFNFNPQTSVLLKKHDFVYAPQGASPVLPFGIKNQVLIGAASGGNNGNGVLYDFLPTTSSYNKKAELTETSGKGISSGILHPNGKVYFTTNVGGLTPASKATLVEYNPLNGQLTVVHNFEGPDGAFPTGIVLLKNGNLMGSTRDGGTHSSGVIFEFNPQSGLYTKRFEFDHSVSGGFPSMLAAAPDGVLYGTSRSKPWGESSYIFKYDPVLNVHTNLKQIPDSFGLLNYKVAVGLNGKIYGLTMSGGQSNNGVLYEFDPVSTDLTKKKDLLFPIDDSGLTTLPDGRIMGNYPGQINQFKGSLFVYNAVTDEFIEPINFNGANGSFPGGKFLITKNDQSIAFDPIPSKKVDIQTFNLKAESSSGLPVTFTSSDNSIATVSGKAVTIIGGGEVYITAVQSGNEVFNAAPPARRLLKIAKQDQSITFTGIADKLTIDLPFDLTATSSSGLAVTYSSSNDNVATVTGKVVTIIGEGKTTITATQSGNGFYNEASSVSRELNVEKAAQTITFGVIPSKKLGDNSFQLSATSSSGLAVTYSSSNGNVATVAGTVVTIVGGGKTIIEATQAGNTLYKSASPVSHELIVERATQTITFETISSKTLGNNPFQLSATSSSGLPVTFSTSSDKISITSSTVTLEKAGKVIIKANQAGSDNYEAAPFIEQNFCINPPKPVITSGNGPQPELSSSNDLGNQWFLNGAVIQNATEKKLIVESSGIYTVRTRIEDCESELSGPINIVITGLDEAGKRLPIGIYPNPFNKELIVDLNSFPEKEFNISLMDLLGHAIESKRVYGGIHSLTVNSLPSGIYLIKVEGQNSSTIKRVVKSAE